MFAALVFACLQFAALAPDRVAPVHAWYVEGGSASRSAASACLSLRGRLAEAWVHAPEWPIVGEPRVWNDLVVLELDAGADGRVLRFLDLRHGGRLAVDRRFPKAAALHPSLWGDSVLVCAEPDVLQIYRLRGRGTASAWRRQLDEPAGPPLMVEDSVYVVGAGAAQRLRIGRSQPAWTSQGSYYSGAALRDGRVYLVHGQLGPERYESPRLRVLDGATGLVAGSAGISSLIPRLEGTWSEIAVFGSGVAMHFRPAARTGHGLLERIFWTRPDPAGDDWRLGALPGAQLGDVVEWRGGWLAAVSLAAGGAGLAAVPDADDGAAAILATPAICPDFADPDAPVTRVRDAAYVGAGAFEIETGRVLWRLPYRPSARIVPVRRTLLLVDEGRRLVALHEAIEAEDAAQTPAAWPGRVRCCFRDGGVRTGEWSVDADAGELALGAERWSLRDLALAETEAGALLHAADAALGVRALVADRQREILLGALAQATRAGEPERLAELLQRLGRIGAEDRGIADAVKTLERWEAKPPKPDAKRLEALDAARREADAAPVEVPRARLAALPAEAPDARRAGLLRAWLEAAPEDPDAAAAVLALLPEELRAAIARREGEIAAAEWLDLAEVTRRVPVAAGTPADAAPADSPLGARLRLAREGWRDDLIALRSRNLLILSGASRPGAIARCLELGETVCSALEELFPAAEGGPLRAGDEPMVLQLFETREEYLDVCSGDDREERAHLEWTSGHYLPEAELSRFYLPDGPDAEGFEATLEVLAHELTHHWLDARCPRFVTAPIEARIGLPGYWLVEGVASLIEEYRFRPDLGRWDARHPQSPGLDLIAASAGNELLTWPSMLAASKIRFDGFSAEHGDEKYPLPTAARLGGQREGTVRAAYYLQAAALARFLAFAEDGAHRGLLLELVDGFYAGRTDVPARARLAEWAEADLSARLAAYAAEEMRPRVGR